MRRTTATLSLATLVVASCTSSPPRAAPQLPIGWVAGAAAAANGAAPAVDLLSACGSTTATFLDELVTTSPLSASVQREWGDCAAGGKQMMLAGTIAKTHLGPTDVPFDHPFGDDLSMDVDIDPAFDSIDQQLGTGQGEDDEAADLMHVEISAGFIPHVPRPPNPSEGQIYRAAADFNLDPAGFQPGFAQPAPGDRAVLMGRWIIDCGHPDFSAELHALSFVGFAHVEGARTTARFYYNPYRDTELYASTAVALGAVSDSSRFANAATFPRQLVHEVLGLDSGAVDRLRVMGMIEATKAPPADFRVCAPQGAGSLVVSSDIVTRPDVTLTVSAPDAASGCVTVHASLEAYTPVDATVRACTLPWSYLDQIISTQTGQTIDVLSMIDGYLSTDAGKQRAGVDPECSCGDALAGPRVSDVPAAQSVRKDGTQPFPFYGVVTVERR